MSLQLLFHPLSSFCQKALIALYETEVPFEKQILNLGDETEHARFKALWPIARMPVLRDGERTIPEATIIIEYLAQHHPGRTELLPRDADLALQTRLRDRFYDLYVDVPMQKIVTDRLRPEGQHDPFGVQQAKELLVTAYGIIERELETRTWAMGKIFTMADCAAAPALFYANEVVPFGDTHPTVKAYFERLMKRPSFARVFQEAAPYRALFPSS
jgi:glutathione S-transferase